MVSEDVRNTLRDDLIVVPLFSRGRSGPTRVELPAGAGGLPAGGVFFCEEITTIDRDCLREGPTGSLAHTPIMGAVIRAVRRALGEVVPN